MTPKTAALDGRDPWAAAEALRERQRILVIGCSGSGKSTFAARLRELLELPLIHLDVHHWLPGWVARPTSEWRDRVRKIVNEPAWIIDGTFRSTLDIRLPACDGLVMLDLPTRVCLGGVLRRWRASRRGGERIGSPGGCPERFDLGFLHWIALYRWQTRPTVERMLAEHGSHAPIVRLRSRRQCDDLLAALAARARTAGEAREALR